MVEWLTLKEIAAELKVSYQFVYRRVQAGVLQYTRIGTNIRVKREWLDEYTGRKVT